MNVLIIGTNRYDRPQPVLPYGACIAADAAASAGHNVRFLDLMFQPDPAAVLKTMLRSFSPDLVGLSVRNLDNNDLQAPVEFITPLVDLVRTLRRWSPAPLVLGGPAVGVMPEALLAATGADYAVLSDGETVFPALLRALETGQPLTAVPRIAWRENGAYRVNGGALPELTSSAIHPRFGHWLDLKSYAANLGAVPLQSRRGCPFACVYCTYGNSEGREYRLYPPEEVAAAVRELGAMGIRDVEFVDNVFNAPYSQALAVCDALARNPHGVRLQTLELNPGFVDDRLLKAMETAGFIGVGVTAESAADPVLSGLKKGYTRAEVERAAAAIRRSNLPCCWVFLMGGPGETRETVADTLRFARRVLRKGDVAFINVGIRIYPGTELEAIARREGVLTRPPEEMLAPVFYFSPQVELPWVLEAVRGTAREHLNILHSGCLSHLWLPAISRLYRRLPLKQPMWRRTREIRRVVRALGQDI